MVAVAPPGGARGESCPSTFVLGCFSSLCKSVEKKFSWEHPPDLPPNFCWFFVPLMKQAVKMHCLICDFICFKHKLTWLTVRVIPSASMAFVTSQKQGELECSLQFSYNRKTIESVYRGKKIKKLELSYFAK